MPHPGKSTAKAFVSANIQVWHERFAHVDPFYIRTMVQNKVITGVEIKKSSFDTIKCDGCLLGKGHRSPIPKKSYSRSSQTLQLVHSDVNGSLETPSLGGSRYFITFVDDYSKWTVVSEAFKYFKMFHKYVEVHTGSLLIR